MALFLPLVSHGTAQAQTATEASTKYQAILDKIRQLKAPRWKNFGSCRYDWGALRLPLSQRESKTQSGENLMVAILYATAKPLVVQTQAP